MTYMHCIIHCIILHIEIVLFLTAANCQQQASLTVCVAVIQLLDLKEP